MSRTHWVPVRSLLPADSPRLDGEDAEHIRLLAGVESKFPPILVHRQSMRVIDGMHRLRAAQLRNEEAVEVQYFDGSEQDAFVLAVKANTTHGRPLSLADRTSAAERIMISHPSWSDRAIAAAAGIGTRIVATVRRRLETEVGTFGGTQSRIGRDGRVRPIDGVEGRLKAAEVIRAFPNASLREIGKQAGVSPATARDVRKRVQRGDEPVPRRAHRRSSGEITRRDRDPSGEPDVEIMLEGLRLDPSLRFSESGRIVLRWLNSKALRRGEWSSISDKLPPHVTYVLARVARRCADEWSEIANDLDRRSRERGQEKA